MTKTLAGKIPNPEETYSIREIYTLGFFPWIRTYQSLFRFIRSRLDELNPIIIRFDTKKTYRISGESIIKLQIKAQQEVCPPSNCTEET